MNDTFHIYPTGDLIAHDISGGDCPCLPHTEYVPPEDGSAGGWITIHHAWDGRP